MKHAQATGSGRVYDEKTHQWVDADEAAPAKPPRRAKAKAAPVAQGEDSTSAAAPAGTDNTQFNEE